MTRIEVLRKAVQTAIAKGCERKTISVPHWSTTYKVSQREVREIWEAELTKDTNSIGSAEGK